jgi:hypothetical protein
MIEIVPPTRNPLIELLRDGRGRASGANAWARLDVDGAACRAALDAIERTASFAEFVKHIPMVREIRKDGDLMRIDLQFRVSVISVKFGAKARLRRESPNALCMDYVEGEPAGLTLRFAFSEPAVLGGKALLMTSSAYEIDSLGWLAKNFLRHHPEIRDGAQTGTAVAIVEALRKAIETRTNQ